jgi:DNA-binding MarR family transcriptional regulator
MKDNLVSARNSDEEPDLDMLSQLVGYNLHRAEIASYRFFIKTVSHPKMTPKQFSVLLLIGANPGISQVDLGNTLGMDRATTMAVIDILQNRQLLQRHKSSIDRRKHALNLTTMGQNTLNKIKSDILKHEGKLTNNLSKNEKEQLNALLIKIKNNLEDQ